MAAAGVFVHNLLLSVMLRCRAACLRGFCLMAFGIINSKRKETTVLGIAGASNAQVLLLTPAHLVAVWACASRSLPRHVAGYCAAASSRITASFGWITPQPAGALYAAAASVVLFVSLVCLVVACLAATLLAYHIDEEQRREEMLLE